MAKNYYSEDNWLILSGRVASQKDKEAVINKDYRISDHAGELLNRVWEKAHLTAGECETYRNMLGAWERMEAFTLDDPSGSALYDKLEGEVLTSWKVDMAKGETPYIHVELVYGSKKGHMTSTPVEGGDFEGGTYKKAVYHMWGNPYLNGIIEKDTLFWK